MKQGGRSSPRQNDEPLLYTPAVPNLPPHVKIQRAKVIVDNEGRKILTICRRCQKETYVLEGRTVCSGCLEVKRGAKPRRLRWARPLK